MQFHIILCLFQTMILTKSLPTCIKEQLPWCMLFADDVVLGNTRREQLSTAVEERGLKISRNNTEYLGTTNTKMQKTI